MYRLTEYFLNCSIGGGRRQGSLRGFGSLGNCFLGRDSPECGIREQAADELSVKGMAGLVRFDAGQQREARQGQIANQIERFVAAELIRKA
jgi:hypothetical protein